MGEAYSDVIWLDLLLVSRQGEALGVSEIEAVRRSSTVTMWSMTCSHVQFTFEKLCHLRFRTMVCVLLRLVLFAHR